MAKKSLLYIPGLALGDGAARATTPTTFKDKVARTFELKSPLKPRIGADDYMVEMVDAILNKGAVPADCTRALCWVQISAMTGAPRPAAAKAMQRLGTHSDNVLGKQAGATAKPIPLLLGGHEANLACKAPEYLGQPTAMPGPGAAPGALSTLVAGDTLYIVGHSNTNGNALTYKYAANAHLLYTWGDHPGCPAQYHCEKRHVDPVTLGSLLVDEGLPRGVQFDIAIVACFSGGLANDELQTVQSFAQRLAGTLNGRGYRCRVYGAKGLTSVERVRGRPEVHVAATTSVRPITTTLPDKSTRTVNTVVVDIASARALTDDGSQPFYKRFFRIFG